ncbi:uncharacterized protein [Lepisosteus oculatus]|uniref:uncharacterized protein isoform X2 n=1 Tax=Lepisosteus oculatus TaxID=7918 RepID=UPI0035F50CA9
MELMTLLVLVAGFCNVVGGHEENVTVTNGHPLNISLYTRGSVKVQFTPEGSGVSVLVCAVEKSIVTPNQLYKPRVSLQDKTLQLSGVSFSDQGSYTVLDLGTDRIISTVRVRVEGHEENVTVTNGHPLNISLYTRENVKVKFTPDDSGDSVLVCAVENSTVTPDQHYKPRVSVQDKTLQLSGVSFSDQGSYTVLDLRTDRIISTVRVRVEDSDSTWLAPVIGSILAVLVAAGVISVLVRHLRSGQSLSASSANGSSRAGPSPRSSPGSGVELLGNGAAGNRPGPADPLVTPQFPHSPAQPQSDGSQQEESCYTKH